VTTAPIQKNVALALSGGGRTLKNLIAKQNGKAYRIAAIICSKTECPGLDTARELGLPTFIASFGAAALPELQSDLQKWLHTHAIEWIALGGFLKPFPPILGFEQRTINIHPALLPNYGGKGMYGMNVHRAVLKNQDKISGATIHFVNEHYDEGAIIAQIHVPLDGLADAEAIASRIFAGECQLYPETLDRLCQGSLPLADGAIFTLEA
jgi:phosphoribosylglycinamide formyltransferase-1